MSGTHARPLGGLPEGLADVASPTGAVIHVLNIELEYTWTLCSRHVESSGLNLIAAGTDERRRCRTCASWLTEAIRRLEYQRAEERRHQQGRELGAIMEEIAELSRGLQIARGVDPDEPETVEEVEARTIALRARNDQKLAELRGAWRVYD